MTLIPCNEECAYQKDGYCTLETAAAITDCTQSGCVHKVKMKEPQKPV